MVRSPQAPPPEAASTEATPASATIGVADAYRFFLPLMLMAELMMISHAVIAAFLVRMPDPETILAAYAVAFALHATLGSPVWACQIVFLSFIRDRLAVRRLFAFGMQTVLAIAWIWLILSLTPVGDMFLTGVFGVSKPVAEAAKLCLLVSLWIPPTSVIRSLAYAILMAERKTIYVTLGTIIRLAALAALLAVLTDWFSGAVIGILALAGCITVETIVAVLIAYPVYKRLAASGKPVPGY